MPQRLIGLAEARRLVSDLAPLGGEVLSLHRALGRVCSETVVAAASCPSTAASLKDGFAVRSTDVAAARPERPVPLKLHGTVVAGEDDALQVHPGTAVRIMTGARIPAGANAVLASEFAVEQEGVVLARADAEPGRNILAEGADVRAGAVVVEPGVTLQPGHLGLLAAAGLNAVQVCQLPRVVIAATGSELVAPGEPIGPGKVAASNMVTLQAELARLGIKADCQILRDDLDHLEQAFAPLLEDYDVVLTCGGVLDGDKDLTLAAMDHLGVELIFHRVRMGPGKGIAMGRKGATLIFTLPGGPPSNHIAFLILALPGIRRLAGFAETFPGKITAPVEQMVKGMTGWSQFVYATLHSDEENCRPVARPFRRRRRLQAMAAAQCLIEIPEDVFRIEAGTCTTVWNIR